MHLKSRGNKTLESKHYQTHQAPCVFLWPILQKFFLLRSMEKIKSYDMRVSKLLHSFHLHFFNSEVILALTNISGRDFQMRSWWNRKR